MMVVAILVVILGSVILVVILVVIQAVNLVSVVLVVIEFKYKKPTRDTTSPASSEPVGDIYLLYKVC